VVRSTRGQLLVNPGSVGLPAYDDIHPVPHVVEVGSPDARYAVVERVAGNWMVCLVSVPYDHWEIAELARIRQRPDWVSALTTGRMPAAEMRSTPTSGRRQRDADHDQHRRN
jgi:hypothetical protein